MRATGQGADGGRSVTALAYTYAWWLTGEEATAAAAVRSAAPGTVRDLGVALDRVRAAAIDRRTLCPASELALLHDGLSIAAGPTSSDTTTLDLATAARVAQVPAADARTTLAHGRLEALVETVHADFRHPERLGGLAVGNPADVAHARQCRDCGAALDLLQRGRAALAALPPVPASVGLLDGRAPDRQRRTLAAMVVVVAVGAVAAVAFGRSVPGQVAAAPGSPVPSVTADDPAPSALMTGPAATTTALTVVDAGIAIGTDPPRQTGAVLGPDAPVRLVVRYAGARAGAPLTATWTVEGVAYRTMAAVLPGGDSSHTFGARAPAGGWPVGAHALTLTAGGVVVGAVAFAVA